MKYFIGIVNVFDNNHSESIIYNTDVYSCKEKVINIVENMIANKKNNLMMKLKENEFLNLRSYQECEILYNKLYNINYLIREIELYF
jgi:hypothetical protein